MKALWNNTILAESDDTLVVEGNHYFPLTSIHCEYFHECDHQTVCPWKGTARYYDIEVNGEVNHNAAWHYPEPKPAADSIRGRVAFWKGVEIVEQPLPPGQQCSALEGG